MTDTLKQLWESTVKFQQRFDLRQFFNLPNQMRVVNEEMSEFRDEVDKLWYADLGVREYAETQLKAAREAADVIVTLMYTLSGLGLDYCDIAQALEQVAAKNDAKTHETHTIDGNGKVSRKDGN